jgi:hypothetical protein
MDQINKAIYLVDLILLNSFLRVLRVLRGA